jgi:sterol 24-C-methyltransferase
MTDKYDKSDAHHRHIAHGIEVGDGIPEMRKIDNARDALSTVGFEVIYDEDLADRPDEIVRASKSPPARI